MSFRLNERRNCETSRTSSSSPTCGSLVFRIETSAAKTGVNGRDAACAFMMLRAKRPLPRMRFSAKSSGTTFFMFEMLTLLTIPVMLFLSASHDSRWYSVEPLSCAAACCRARRRAGGMYTPPLRVPASFANSAAWSNFGGAAAGPSSSASAMRRASWRSRSTRRAWSVSTTCGKAIVTRGAGAGETERRRFVGGDGSRRGLRERESDPDGELQTLSVGCKNHS